MQNLAICFWIYASSEGMRGREKKHGKFHCHDDGVYLWWTQTYRQWRAEIPTGNLAHRHTCMACLHCGLLSLPTVGFVWVMGLIWDTETHFIYIWYILYILYIFYIYTFYIYIIYISHPRKLEGITRRDISSQETRRSGSSSLDLWTMVFFSFIAYLTLNHPYELLYSFSSQQNIKQNVKMKPRGNSANDLCMCGIQTLTLKPFTLKIYPPFPFFSLKVTIFFVL